MKTTIMRPWAMLLRKIHHDERGSVSLEKVLLLGGIAIPILLFILKTGWPRVRQIFLSGLEELEEGIRNASR